MLLDQIKEAGHKISNHVDEDVFIIIKQDQPLPCSVLAIYPTLVTSDG